MTTAILFKILSFPKITSLIKSVILVGILFQLYQRLVQVNQDGLKLNGTHQLLAYADDVNILEGSAHTVKENTEALVVTSKEIRLEVNADKTKHMVISRD